MYKGCNFIGIIPARAGSKRCPGKNTRLLGDKPLISWTIEHAQKSKLLDSIIVTSDDAAVHSICQKSNIQFLHRPQELASDNATSAEVVMHTLGNIVDKFSHIVLLQPTSPFRNDVHIDEAIKLCIDGNAKSCVSFVENNDISTNAYVYQQPNLNALHGQLIRLNGAIYISEINRFEESQEFIDKTTIPYIMSLSHSVDIDTEEDFNSAFNFLSSKAHAS